MPKSLKLTLSATVIAGFFMAVQSSIVNAAPVVTLEDCGSGSANCATGITGLSANGGIWNIDFVLGDYTSATALGTNAADFGAAIDAALQATVAEWISEPDSTSSENSYSVLNAFIPGGPGVPPFNTPTDPSVSHYKGRYACVISLPGCTPQWFGITESATPASQKYWVVATTAPVPIPSAVWLFGSGLMGLVGMARRKAT